jgi:hypothetical protein
MAAPVVLGHPGSCMEKHISMLYDPIEGMFVVLSQSTSIGMFFAARCCL